MGAPPNGRPRAHYNDNDLMSAIRASADALYAEEVARARAMRPDEKLLEGLRLFERACRLMADGIRHTHPDLDAAGVARMVAERFARLDALDRR